MFRILPVPTEILDKPPTPSVHLHTVKTLAAIALLATATTHGRDASDEIIYFVLTDRFHDADPANNTPPGCDPALHDIAQTDINRYHGGDLRGLELAIRAGYFRELGVTALWITPPVKNVWRSGYDLGGWKSGYHGYWTQDFLDIDPHLTSATALDGSPYPDSAEGRMQHYRDFVKLAHDHGLKVIQDVVLNHAGPVFYYDADGDESFDKDLEAEWVQPFKPDGFHASARWGEVPAWNFRRTMPDGPRELLGKKIPTRGLLAELDTYGRKGFSWDSLGKSDGEEITCDFFSLRDFWTDPSSGHFDALVDEFVEIYDFYLTTVGIDGLRIDTVKHVHHAFWDAFTERLRKRLGPAAKDKILFGEVYDGNPARLGQYTWRSDAPANPAPCLDSVLSFQLCFAMRDYLRRPGDEFGTAHQIEGAMLSFTEGRFEDGRPFFNPNPGPDGLNSIQKSITFIENHDGLNRFRAEPVSARRHDLAQALVMTLPGIPCLYYGAETAMHDVHGRLGEDGETGRATLWKRGSAPALAKLREDPSFSTIRRLADARRDHPALRDGSFRPLWCDGGESWDDGIFAFARVLPGGGSVIIAMNASSQAARTGDLNLADLFPGGAEIRAHALVGEAPAGPFTHSLPVPPSSVVLYHSAPPSP